MGRAFEERNDAAEMSSKFKVGLRVSSFEFNKFSYNLAVQCAFKLGDLDKGLRFLE